MYEQLAKVSYRTYAIDVTTDEQSQHTEGKSHYMKANFRKEF